MKRIGLFIILFLMVMSYGVTIVNKTAGKPELTKSEKFALELKACKEAQASGNPGKCGLYGKIQYVTSFSDVKVQLMSSFADGPGKWQIVDSFPDYKVQIVDSFPDYKIEYVTSFPGCN